MTFSMEGVHTAKPQPRQNQSELMDLHKTGFAIHISYFFITHLFKTEHSREFL